LILPLSLAQRTGWTETVIRSQTVDANGAKISDMPERPTGGPLSGGTPANVNCFNCDSASTELVEMETPVLRGAARIYRCRQCGYADWLKPTPGRKDEGA
jgi:hypothetical protein